ncbi:uncharacterized protein N7498_007004 [Penicillium cinerascens]|uniref:Xylanolytic transcriptional activator regulatory domain-containing protein n=1 Tax=Penicillium cinerascens TaxID=70096 RepID=A0A9W9MF17_9EURO|nr:uncharacterized protein N7498_007004 [Penicillium cinerascens]KAJ5197887.1 hypothetical protein N7498_007004 [Penicillium cinerascens]
MTSKKQKHSYNSGQGAALNEASAKQSGTHSAPGTPKRASGDTPRSGKTSSSAPALGDAKFTNSKASNAKVAIPRQPPGITQRYNRRVPRAEVDRLSAEVQDYESFMDDLRNSVESRTDWIKTLLEKHDLKGDSTFDHVRSQLSTPQNEMEPEEPSPLSSIGSLDAIDRVEEDHNRSEHTRATGYMGKTSEITWMQRLQREAEQRARGKCGTLESEGDEDDETKDKFSLSALNYHLDDLSISVAEPIQKYTMPPRHLADRLFDDYLKTVHPFFPIISKTLFCAQYQTFFDNSTRSNSVRPGDKWLAILNVIFAIAAKHAHLMNSPWRGNQNDHLMYLARARLLSMNSEALFAHPDLQQVQVEGLIAFYLLASDQINRAWRISALAVRSAITLGINLKNQSLKTPHISKEARYKVWWCIYSFEHMLGIMTGRAISTPDGGYATPLPLPFEEDQLQEDAAAIEILNDPNLRDEQINNVMASSLIRQTGSRDRSQTRDQSWVRSLPITFGLCYLYNCDLTIIAQEIINKVYSTNCVMLPWSEIESRIDEAKSRIDFWRSILPAGLDFTQKKSDDSHNQLRCKLALGFHYYSVRITLGRPCLCRRDARQNASSQPTFSHTMAVVTLESACGMIDLIPDEPNVLQLYDICPWWCILRQMMQAAIVLLLELSFGSVHMPEEEEKFVRLAKKCIRWFYAMPEHSSRRAWQLCDSSFRKLASGMKYSIDDIPSHPYQQDPNSSMTAAHLPFHPPTAPSSRDYFTLPEEMSIFGSRQVPEADLWTSYFNLPTPDLMSSLQGPVEMADSYFPYDPLSEEFIRSLLPSSEDPREQH